MTNRALQTILLGCLLLAILFAAPERRLHAAESPRPNIVFIMADDHALEAVGCYGSWLKDCVVTPAIDQLAAEGMRFNNFCCNNSIWYAYWTAGHPHWGVRTDRYKLIKFPETAEFEFYDLKEDRFEMNNLAGDAAYAEAITAANASVARLIQQVDIAPNQMPGQRDKGNSPTLKQDRQRKRK